MSKDRQEIKYWVKEHKESALECIDIRIRATIDIKGLNSVTVDYITSGLSQEPRRNIYSLYDELEKDLIEAAYLVHRSGAGLTITWHISERLVVTRP